MPGLLLQSAKARMAFGLISNMAGGFEGPRVRGKVLPGGGDWILCDSDNVWHMDVRLLLRTEDDAMIYLQYFGSLKMNDSIQSALYRE